MGFIAYNVIMALQVAASLFIVRHSRRPAPFRTVVGFVMAALGLGSVIGLALIPDRYEDNTFAMMSMWAYALFIYLPILLLGLAWLLWARRRYASMAMAALALIVVAVAIDAFWWEPYDLQVRRVVVHSEKLDRAYRIAVLADIQTDTPGPFELRVFRRTLAMEPDLVLLPGDYVQADSTQAYAEAELKLNALMKQVDLRAPLGVHAVQGNVDVRGQWPEIFDGLPASTYAVTTTVAVGGLVLTPLSFDDSFTTDLVIPAVAGFQIVFGHGPDFALGDVQADLLIAGHTHGGQVQIPGFGPPVTFSRVPRAWADGVTALPGKRTLVVSRGIGMERKYAPRLRFFCPPEIVIVDLIPGADPA